MDCNEKEENFSLALLLSKAGSFFESFPNPPSQPISIQFEPVPS